MCTKYILDTEIQVKDISYMIILFEMPFLQMHVHLCLRYNLFDITDVKHLKEKLLQNR